MDSPVRLPVLFNSLLAHGTFVGSIRVDPHKPVQVLVDSTLAFGASTRRFTLRERPNAQVAGLDSLKDKDDKDKTVHSLLGLPEEDTALDVSGPFYRASFSRLSHLFPLYSALLLVPEISSSLLPFDTLPNLSLLFRSFSLLFSFSTHQLPFCFLLFPPLFSVIFLLFSFPHLVLFFILLPFLFTYFLLGCLSFLLFFIPFFLSLFL